MNPTTSTSKINVNNLNQETAYFKQQPASTNQTQLGFPKKNDTISIMCNDKTWFDAVVLGWGGKITSKNKNWANVQLNDIGQCITLDKVHLRNAVEDINIV